LPPRHPDNLVMLATWWALCSAFLVVAVAEGTSYDPLLDLDAYPEFLRGVQKYRQHFHRRHLRSRHPHKMALAHHFAVPDRVDSPKMTWSPDTDNSPPKPEGPRMLLGRHPSVEKALDGMGGDLVALKEKQLAAKESRGELERKVNEVESHMNDAMSIKHAIQKKEAQIRIERSKLLGLEREAKHVEETHASLVSSLHRVLEPKLMFARTRLERKEMIQQKDAEAVKVWQEKMDQVHAHALELLKEKKVLLQQAEQAEQDVAEAKKREEITGIKYKEARQQTSREIQSFRYAETRVKAEITHEKAAEEATAAAKESVEKLGNVLQVESEKVEESMTVSKNQIRNRMEKIDAAREQAVAELADLQQQYKGWQENQRVRAADVIQKAQDTAERAEAYADRQKQVLDSASSKVVHDAEAKSGIATPVSEITSDWAEEGGFGSDDAGFAESLPSFTD